MKIELQRIPLEGVRIKEQISPRVLELEDELITYPGPVMVEAEVWRLTNAVTIKLFLQARALARCSDCACEFEMPLERRFTLNLPVSLAEQYLDLNPEIREELLLNIPIRFLCRPDCKGLCPACGKNLNEGGCSCATT